MIRTLAGRSRKPAPTSISLFALVERQRDALDQLLAELTDGPRGAGHYNELEARAGAIGDGLRAAFRQHRS